jgi:TolB-like protein
MKPPVRLRALAASVLAWTCAAAIGSAAQDAGATPAPAPAGPTIAVLDFTNSSGQSDYDWLKVGLADMLATDLAASGKLRLVERRDLDKVLGEQELGQSGAVDESTAPRVGKLAGASRIAYGSFLANSGTLRIDAKVVDSETGAFVAAGSAQGEASLALSLEAELAGKLMAALGVDRPAGAGTSSIEAAKAYYSGLILFDSGKYEDAVALFKEATMRDPLYAKPRSGIEESYKFLKDFDRQRRTREINAVIADIEALKRRLAAPVFMTFAAALTNPGAFGFADAQSVTAAYRAHPAVWNGDTPVQAMWNLQRLYMDLGAKGMEQSGDANLKARCEDEIAAIARVAEERYPEDPFLPEVLYMELLDMREKSDWEALKTACERIMTQWPDYRMMWSVEDMYKKALDGLGPGPAPKGGSE